MATKTIDIICSECGKTITMSAEDAHIISKFIGGCLFLRITVKCPHCNAMSVVEETSESHDLLDDKINSRYIIGKGIFNKD